MSTQKNKRLAIHLTAAIAFLVLDVSILTKGLDVPSQCTNYRNLTEKHRNVDSSPVRVLICDNKIKGIAWYRFSGQAGNIMPSRHVLTGDCGTENPGRLIGVHPCGIYDTADAQVCFVNRRGDCGSRVNISITFCGKYYVYQLPEITNCSTAKKRYCGEDSNVPISSCNITSTPIYPTTSSGTGLTTRLIKNSTGAQTTMPDWRSSSFPTIITTTAGKSSNHNSSGDNSSDNNASVVSDLKEKVEELGRKNISAEERTEVARQIINLLSNLTDLDMMGEEDRENGLNQENLIDTVTILQKIVGLNISNSSLNILAPVNNILDSRNTHSWRNITDDNVLRNLITTLENYGFQHGENVKNKLSASNSTFQNYLNVQLNVKYVEVLKEGESSFPPKERLVQFPDASFDLSPDALPQESGSSAVVVVVWYKTMHSFLRNSFHGDNVYAEVNSKIITASVRPAPRVKFLKPVRITWKSEFLKDSETCVYWKPDLNETKWKTDGCKRIKNKNDSNRLICECDHLTAFASMDISRDMVSKAERQALELISTIGCSVSLFGIFLTTLTYALLWKRLQQNAKTKVPSQVLMHLCVAIGMTDILAILAGPAHNNEIFCTAVSILLYFFVLAVFGWMLCEGIVIYLQLVNVYTGLGLGGRHLKAFYVIGWGVPVVIVSLLVGLNDREDFITKRACWCRGEGVIFWTFVGTIGLILLINMVIFILALRSALSASDVSTARSLSAGRTQAATQSSITLRKAKVGLRGSAVLLPLLGLTWIFGLLVFNRDTIVFKYLFAICNSLQGIMLFLFHVPTNRKVHDAIKREKAAHKTRHMIKVMSNNNNCGTLSTSDNSPRKSSLSATPVFSYNRNNDSLKFESRSKGVIIEDLELS